MNKPRLLGLISAGIVLILAIITLSPLIFNPDIYKGNNHIKLVSRTEGESISYYQDREWHTQFLYGINLGATTPGHHPGELSPTYADYSRWFAGMEKLGVQMVRVYTILPPDFYRALVDHNRQAEHKLWLVQGIWSPEEKLISQKNAYNRAITREFNTEIELTVRAVYGRGEISPRPGKASGIYTANAASCLLAWMVGTEWDPFAVDSTNRINPDKKSYRGQFFRTTSQSSPFEAWLAQLLDKLAILENKQGWQHPISFVNWVTTDPISHPNEPFDKEDLVSVDPIHIKASANWQAGYFSAYHVYPYYPDSLRLQPDYLTYKNARGESEPYEAYLLALKKHHTGIPLVISEFGVPSSRGMAHLGSLNRNQGMHTEKEQGKMNVSMFKAMQNVGMAGGILFSWQDEWFKHTWNTMDLELPAERRSMWLNRLTNEENFGLVAVEPGSSTRVFLDGKLDDWNEIDPSEKKEGGQSLPIKVSSDEGYLYLAIKKSPGWDWNRQDLCLAFDNQPGGNTTITPGGSPIGVGAETLLRLKGPDQGTINVAGAYDQHTYLYGPVLNMIPYDASWSQENNGIFLPWKLCLSRELYLPLTRQTIPFDEIEVGILHPGNSNPESPRYNSLADYYNGSNWIEFRIPWMLLGYTDPSFHQVWAYPYRKSQRWFTNITSPGLNIQAMITDKNSGQVITSEQPLTYNWENWDAPSYHERYKQSYYVLKNYIAMSRK